MAKESPRFAFALGARETQQQQHGFPPQQHGFAPSRAPASFAPPGYTNTNTRQPFALHTSRPAEAPRRTSSFAPRPFATASYDSPRLAPAAHTSLPAEPQAHTARPPAQPAFPHMISRRVVAPVRPAVIEIDQQAHSMIVPLCGHDLRLIEAIDKLDYDERSDGMSALMFWPAYIDVYYSSDPPEPPSDAPAPAPAVPDEMDTFERSLPPPEASRVQPQGDEFQGLFQQLGTQQATIAAMVRRLFRTHTSAHGSPTACRKAAACGRARRRTARTCTVSAPSTSSGSQRTARSTPTPARSRSSGRLSRR
jgi:hypothetical protein